MPETFNSLADFDRELTILRGCARGSFSIGDSYNGEYWSSRAGALEAKRTAWLKDNPQPAAPPIARKSFLDRLFGR